MMLIEITEATYELVTALNRGEPPTVHGTRSFFVWRGNDPNAKHTQCFPWELEEYFPAENTRRGAIIMYTDTERNKRD